MVRAFISFWRASEPVADRLVWRFEPSELELDGHRFTGFSYDYRFESADPARKIHRIFDFATWEIGGALEGNTLLFQGQTNPPATPLAKDKYFTIACGYYGAEMGAVLRPVDRISMQRLSRLATIQSFEFLCHEEGVLFNWFEPTRDVVSILQTNVGEDALHVVDETRRPLATTLETNRKHVLFAPTVEAWSREHRRNLWRAAMELVHGRERKRMEIQRSYPAPTVWTPQVPTEKYQFGGDTGPRERTLHYLAEEVAPRWAEMGVKEICCPSLWTCDYTVDRFRCKNETGLQGGFTVSGICCVRVHEIDELWGGEEALAYFVEAAHRHGMEVRLWWATHLSRRAPIFKQRPEFMVRSRDGRPGCELKKTYRGLLPHAVPAWGAELKKLAEEMNPDVHERRAALVLLGASRADSALAVLKQAMEERRVAGAAVEGLGFLGDESVIPRLRTLCEDYAGREKLRRQAADPDPHAHVARARR